jgi:hypothetical protein
MSLIVQISVPGEILLIPDISANKSAYGQVRSLLLKFLASGYGTDRFLLCPTKKRAVAWIQSFLEPVYRKRGLGARPASLRGKESVGTQQRWGKQEKKWRRTHSGHDEGGSAANRVRRLLPLTPK